MVIVMIRITCHKTKLIYTKGSIKMVYNFKKMESHYVCKVIAVVIAGKAKVKRRTPFTIVHYGVCTRINLVDTGSSYRKCCYNDGKIVYISILRNDNDKNETKLNIVEIGAIEKRYRKARWLNVRTQLSRDFPRL